MPPCPAWVLQSRHPTEHILYCMGLKRSFDLVGAVQYLVFELLFEWAFARRDLKCVEFLARLNRDGRNMAFKRLLQVRRPTFLDTTSQPALSRSPSESNLTSEPSATATRRRRTPSGISTSAHHPLPPSAICEERNSVW